MGTEYGKGWRIHIGDGEGVEAFTPIGGELSFEWSRTSNEIDESSKDDGDYGSTGYGAKKISFSVNGNLKLPDPGLERADEVAKASIPEVNLKVLKGAIVKFAGKVSIGNFSTTHPKEGPCTYSFNMANKGAPTVDNLGAAA